MRIKQAHVSQSLIHFKEGFLKRWNLIDYHDPSAPVLFVGVYGTDYLKVNAHKEFKLVLFGGADIPNATRLIWNNMHVVCDQFTYDYKLNEYWIPTSRKFVHVPWKDYSDFKPVQLGDKIYSYQSMPSPGSRVKYRYDILEKVIAYFGKENVLIGYQGHTIKEMIDEFYSRSFVNLQLNPIAGFTTTLEMAHLGRLSVSNFKAPFCLDWTDADSVINRIKTIKDNGLTADATGFLHNSDDWLDTDFWS